MTEMFGSKEDFGCPKYSSADSYIGILSAFNGEIQHSKLSRNNDSLVSLINPIAAIFFILFIQRSNVNTIEFIHGDGIVRRLEMSNCAILYPYRSLKLQNETFPRGVFDLLVKVGAQFYF